MMCGLLDSTKPSGFHKLRTNLAAEHLRTIAMVTSMNSLDELKTAVRRNMLLGVWAAEKLGFVGDQADAYAKELSLAALDAERSDMLSKIRKDFDLAGGVQSDEQILRVMENFMLQASAQLPTARGSIDAAEVMLKRRLAGSR